MQKSTTSVILLLFLAVAGAYYVMGLPQADEVKGETGFTLTIYYEDGDEKTIDSTTNPLSSITPLQVVDSGGRITSIKVEVKMKPVFSGSYSAASLEDSWLTMTIDPLAIGSTINFKSYGDTVFVLPGSMQSGSWYTIFSKTYTESSIESAVANYGTYTMKIQSGVYLTMIFGTTGSQKSASASATWGFKYSADPPTGALTSIDITVGRSSLR